MSGLQLRNEEHRLVDVDSTMEAARARAAGQDFLLVTAETQSQGKGTKGRAWQSPRGNVYMTVGVNRRHLPNERLALFPLELGLLLWQEAASRLPEKARGALSLKWPNDLLLGGAKAAGMLVEGQGEMILAGIGVNVASAPEVRDGGSSSACLADFGMPPQEAPALASGLYARIVADFSDSQSFDPEKILLDWQGKVDWNRSHLLRDREGRPWVQPVSVNRHGHLMVRFADGRHEWLISEYLI
jgi:BirA family biotin operon repressor/biotin-[acetyl-CoA-carboxylase] ligase